VRLAGPQTAGAAGALRYDESCPAHAGNTDAGPRVARYHKEVHLPHTADNTPPLIAPRGIWQRIVGPLLVLAALVAVIIGCAALYRVEAARLQDAERQRESARVGVLAELMRSEVRPVADILRLLIDGDGLQEYLASGNPASLAKATRLAQVVSANHPEFDQIRFIDASGMEVMRIDHGGVLVPREELQDKSGHEFFRSVIGLEQGGLYISALDLSIEDGAIVIPHRPMLRLGSPVFDAAGRVRGIYVIHYLGEALFGRLRDAVPAYAHRLRLLDADGYWIVAEHPGLEWGAQLPGREEATLARSDPELWSRISAEDSGQVMRPGGTPFTWQRVPMSELAARAGLNVHSRQPYLVVAAEILPAEWTALTAGVRNIMLLVAAGLMALTLFSAWLIRGWTRALRELRGTNQFLEERVRSRTAELARINQELREREELLEETGRLAQVGGWEFDPVTGEGAWTAQIARIHDLPTDVKPSRDMALQYYPPEERERIAAAVMRSLRDGTSYDLELRLVNESGEQKWVRTISRPLVENGRVVRMRGAMQDITTRKLTELRLQQQLRRMHLLEETTRAIGQRQDLDSILQVVTASVESRLPLDFGCVCLYEPPDDAMAVAAMGPEAARIGADAQLAPGTRVEIGANGLARCVQGHLVHEPDLSILSVPLARQLAGAGLAALVAAPLVMEGMVFGVLLAARRKAHSFSSDDCEFLRQLSEHVALAVHQAKLRGALQAAYEDLATTQQAVMQQERLRVLGQMASGIAHDINNAISPIMLYAGSLLESEPALSERARHALLTIQQAVSDVAETVARLREFYRNRNGSAQLQPLQLNQLVSQVPDLTRARWQSMPQRQGVVIDLKLGLDEALPQVRGIENEIREALVNLVFNAVDAMPEGGRLVLRTGRADGRVFVEVSDTGTGMDEETRRRCLEPFFTTKGERGTGLGLAMVYGVMQRHEGDIQIDSTPGSGTTVRLLFNEATARQEGARVQAPVVVRGLNILLVDDDQVLLRSLREILELDAHTVVAAPDGREGIEMFRASLAPGARPVSVVITDLGMPTVDGRAVAAAVKLAAPQVPVILLTGWGERLIAEGQSIPHVDRVIGKPPRLHELRAALAELTQGGRAG
jgi:signal transduction histidine kinase/ActR/RegA family two-component response regulator/PAS domain-containing protein